MLVAQAAQLGMGQLRIFLIWPWIQAESATNWEWKLWDEVFDACDRHSLKVKATLTANSGPWWLGTGSVLHSATLTLDQSWLGPQEAYVRQAVERYRNHPALGQWILWNEPGYPLDRTSPELTRPVGASLAWEEVLRERYPDIGTLNRRWRTGYASFGEVPFLEDIVHPSHRDWYWHAWAPYYDDSVLRAKLLEAELEHIADIVRALDPVTPLCINPNQTLKNHAESGVRLATLARNVDVLGASFHAPWAFADFAEVDDHTPLVVAGLRLLAHTPGNHQAEVTEVQTGNTFYAGLNPMGVTESDIAATYLAPLLAGATSVTGWCFNTRGNDFEAGEWGLLNDDDTVSDRARALPRVRDCLSALDERVGPWTADAPTASVVVSPHAQALQHALAQNTHTPWGARAHLGIQAGALAAVELQRMGVQAALADSASPILEISRLVVALHQIAWSSEEAERVLSLAEGGATVFLDGTTGQFDPDATLWRPWPGILASRTGLRALGLESAQRGGAHYEVRSRGRVSGALVGVRSRVAVTDDWSPRGVLTWSDNSGPVTFERAWGSGRLLYSTASLATSLVDQGSSRVTATSILAEAIEGITIPVRPLSEATIVLPISGEHGTAWGVCAPPSERRGGRGFAVSMSPGRYRDVWSGQTVVVGSDRVARFSDSSGLAVIVSTEER